MSALRYSILAIMLLGLQSMLRAQVPVMSTVGVRWQDSFVEWQIFSSYPNQHLEADEAPEEEYFGELKLRWLNVREDWTDWEFDLAGLRGTVRQKWKDDPQQWELRSYAGAIITMRTAWNGFFNEWRVSDNTITLNLKSRWTNQFDEWEVKDSRNGTFYMYTLRPRDPRDWAIVDKLDSEISEEMRLALVFLVLFNSSPKM